MLECGGMTQVYTDVQSVYVSNMLFCLLVIEKNLNFHWWKQNVQYMLQFYFEVWKVYSLSQQSLGQILVSDSSIFANIE